MKLGSRRLKRSGEKSRNGRLGESDEDASSVFRRVHPNERGQSYRRNRSDQSNIGQMFSGFAGAVAHHRLALLRVGAVWKAAHHRRERRLAGHAPGDRSERNGQKSHDGEDGVGASHLRKINTASRWTAIGPWSAHRNAQDLTQRTPRWHGAHRERVTPTASFPDRAREETCIRLEVAPECECHGADEK
jgi:hypothetical protein